MPATADGLDVMTLADRRAALAHYDRLGFAGVLVETGTPPPT